MDGEADDGAVVVVVVEEEVGAWSFNGGEDVVHAVKMDGDRHVVIEVALRHVEVEIEERDPARLWVADGWDDVDVEGIEVGV